MSVPDDPEKGAGEGPGIPARFILYLTLAVFSLAILSFVVGLPAALNMPLLTVRLPTPTPQPSVTAVPPTPTALAVKVVIGTPSATADAPRPSPTVQAQRFVVGNTNGDGVALRRTPNLNDRWVPWPDRTPMVVVGPDVTANGLTWKNVRDPRGNVGFIPSQYLVPAP